MGCSINISPVVLVHERCGLDAFDLGEEGRSF
jgi:hypothetical protein